MKISFHDTLWNLKNDELLRLLKLLEVKPELQNKGALVDKLKAEYSGEGLRRMWESLSQLERLAVAEALYH